MAYLRENFSKSLAVFTFIMETHDSLDDDEVKKDVAYLVKNFRKFLKFKKNENLLRRENS